MRRALDLSIRMLLVLCMMLAVSSCSDDEEGREVSVSNIVGTWSKVYPKGVVAEGYKRIIFRPSVKGYVEVYNALTTDSVQSTTDYDFTYTIVSKDNKVTLLYDDGSTESYYIIKLTASHMT